MSIGTKLAAVMDACRYNTKDGYNSFQKYNYATAAGLFAKVNEELVKNGLFIKQTKSDLVSSEVTTNAKGSTEKYAVVKATVIIGDTESDDFVTWEAHGSGQDNGDKAIMKANTAAFKYAYLGGLCIAMNDDPEADSNSNAYYSQPKPAQKANGFVDKCSKCGTPVDKNVVDYSKKFCDGHILCRDCQRKYKDAKAEKNSAV